MYASPVFPRTNESNILNSEHAPRAKKKKECIAHLLELLGKCFVYMKIRADTK